MDNKIGQRDYEYVVTFDYHGQLGAIAIQAKDQEDAEYIVKQMQVGEITPVNRAWNERGS